MIKGHFLTDLLRMVLLALLAEILKSHLFRLTLTERTTSLLMRLRLAMLLSRSFREL